MRDLTWCLGVLCCSVLGSEDGMGLVVWCVGFGTM
jgi:hypothetical protein